MGQRPIAQAAERPINKRHWPAGAWPIKPIEQTRDGALLILGVYANEKSKSHSICSRPVAISF